MASASATGQTLVLSITTGKLTAELYHMHNMHPHFERGNYGQNCAYYTRDITESGNTNAFIHWCSTCYFSVVTMFTSDLGYRSTQESNVLLCFTFSYLQKNRQKE